MKITKIHQLTVAVLCFTITSATAQSIKNEVQIIEGAYGIQKKQIIEQVMNLSGHEASRFWAIYEVYEDKRTLLGEERLFLLHDYVIAYPSLTEAKASEITARCFKIDEALARLHKRYYKKVSRELSPLQAARFIQVEAYLQNVVRMQIQTRLPFIGESIPIVGNVTER
jgi:hypothetical protein